MKGLLVLVLLSCLSSFSLFAQTDNQEVIKMLESCKIELIEQWNLIQSLKITLQKNKNELKTLLELQNETKKQLILSQQQIQSLQESIETKQKQLIILQEQLKQELKTLTKLKSSILILEKELKKLSTQVKRDKIKSFTIGLGTGSIITIIISIIIKKSINSP